jgi:hypothetical protein
VTGRASLVTICRRAASTFSMAARRVRRKSSLALASAALLALSCAAVPASRSPDRLVPSGVPTAPTSLAPAPSPSPTALATPSVTAAPWADTPSPFASPAFSASPPSQEPSPDSTGCAAPATDPSVAVEFEDPSRIDAGHLTSIVEFGDLAVVAGSEADNETPAAAIWYTTDGIAWERSTPAPSFASAAIYDLVAMPSALVAVGGRPQSVADAPWDMVFDPLVWSSSDGRQWDLSEPVVLERSGRSAQATVAAGAGSRLVVAGDDLPAVEPGDDPSPPHVAVWTSDNGTDWLRVPDDPAFASAYPTAAAIRDDGLIVIALTLCGEGGCYAGATLTSSDGRQWERHRTESGAGSPATPALKALAVGADGQLIGVGTSFDFDAHTGEESNYFSGTWLSSDGAVWELVAGGPAGPNEYHASGFSHGWAIASVGGRLVTTGGWMACDVGGPSVGISTDGRNWRLAWLGEWQEIQEVTAWRGRIAMLGNDYPEGSDMPSWLVRIESSD